jgi:hypothetical protein
VDENDEGKEGEEEERRSEIVNAPTYIFPLFLFFFVRIRIILIKKNATWSY